MLLGVGIGSIIVENSDRDFILLVFDASGYSVFTVVIIVVPLGEV